MKFLKKFYRGHLFFLGSKKDKKSSWIFRLLVTCNINGDIYLYKTNYICLCVTMTFVNVYRLEGRNFNLYITYSQKSVCVGGGIQDN